MTSTLQHPRYRTTNADALADALAEAGVSIIFGVQGGAALPIFDAVGREPRVRLVATAHEQGAAFAADGYARVRGAPGVCLLTSGPGVLNAVTGLGSAFMDSVPVLALSGQVPSHLVGTDAFQEADALGATLAVTKRNAQVRDASRVRASVLAAHALAAQGRPRPVLLDLPKDVTQADLAPQSDERPSVFVPPMPEPADLDRAARLLAQARRPLVLAGHGVLLSKAQPELAALAERLDAPVTTTLLGLSGFDEDHRLALGMIGMHGTVPANLLQRECDVLLVVGARLDDRATGRLDGFAPEARLVHVDLDGSELGKNRQPEVGLQGDAKHVLGELLARLPEVPPSREAWSRRVREAKEAAAAPLPVGGGAYVPSARAVALLGRLAARDAVVVAGVGQHQMWTALHFGFRASHTWLTSGGLGAMGYALPAAIGAQLAAPHRQVVVVDGDGCMHMTSNELATAVRERLPLKIFVLNNGMMGMVRQWQDLFHGARHTGVDNGGLPSFARLAEAYGARGLRVERPEDAERVFREAFAYNDGPVLVEVPVDPNEHVYPMVPPGKANHEVVSKGVGA